MQLLRGVLQRAAAEAPLLPAAETVQRVSAVSNALADWGRRGFVGGSKKLTPLLLLAQPVDDGIEDQTGCFPQALSGRDAFGGGGAAALAKALKRNGAPPMPQCLLRAVADLMEASAAAAAHGLVGAELLRS